MKIRTRPTPLPTSRPTLGSIVAGIVNLTGPMAPRLSTRRRRPAPLTVFHWVRLSRLSHGRVLTSKVQTTGLPLLGISVTATLWVSPPLTLSAAGLMSCQ